MANITDKQKANLKPLNTLPQRKRKEIARKGAIASNKKQAENKTLRKELETALALVDKKTGKTHQELIAIALIKKAEKGSERAFEVIQSAIGQRDNLIGSKSKK